MSHRTAIVVWAAMSLACRAATPRDLSKLPLAFEPNRGQTDPRVRYLARSGSMAVFLTGNGFALATSGQSISMGIMGAPSIESFTPEGRLEGVSNYYKSGQALAGIPHYERVRAHRVRPGIDVLFYGREGQVEYDFVVEPGADARSLTLRFSGSRRPAIASNGDLVLRSGGVEFRHHKPIAFQENGGERIPVDCAYAVLRSGDVRFKLGHHDRSRALTIDPVLSYSTYLGGSSTNTPFAIAVDSSGNAYVAGDTQSSDFPVTSGSSHGYYDAFVTKLSPNGSTLLYSTFIGGSAYDTASGIAVDGAGNAYVAGVTTSPDFAGSSHGLGDAFVMKLGPAGTAVYTKLIAGTGEVRATSIAIDSSACAYVAGMTSSPNLATVGAAQQNYTGNQDAFVAKLDAAGTTVYLTYLGGARESAGTQGTGDRPWAIAVDGRGRAYVVGATASMDFPVTANALQKTAGGIWDGFLTVVSASGGAFEYSSYLGGASTDTATAVALSGGAVFVGGYTESLDFPTTTGAYRTKSGASGSGYVPSSGFVTKFVTSPAWSVGYSTLIGSLASGDAATIWGMAVDNAGQVYVTGDTTSINFPTVPGALRTGMPYGGTGRDAFLAQLNAAGTALLYSTLFGAEALDEGLAMALDGAGNAYIAGVTYSQLFPTTPDARQPAYPGRWTSGFVAKISLGSPATCTPTITPAGVSAPAAGGNVSFTLTPSALCPWEFLVDSGLTVTGAQKGYSEVSTPAPVSVAVAANTSGTARALRVWLSDSNYFTVLQAAAAGCTSTVSPPAIQPAAGGPFTIPVSATDGCSWQAALNAPAPWVTLAYPFGAGSAPAYLKLDRNTGPQRAAGITVAGQNITITQSAAPAANRSASDINGDGVPDLIWQNEATRQVTVNYYGGNGGAVYQGYNWLLASGAPGWRVVAVADFNGDGVPDLVWQNEATRQVTVNYYGGSGGAAYQGYNWLYTNSAPGWKVVAAADFNGDGVPDLVWQNEATRQVSVHYYGGSGGAVDQGWAWLYTSAVPGWRVVAAADFNQDGVPDLVWQNDATRQAVVHYYGGTGGATDQGWAWLQAGTASGWSIVAAQDFNQDGVPDLVWQNEAIRQVVVHYYGGTGGATDQGWNWLNATGAPGWTLSRW